MYLSFAEVVNSFNLLIIRFFFFFYFLKWKTFLWLAAIFSPPIWIVLYTNNSSSCLFFTWLKLMMCNDTHVSGTRKYSGSLNRMAPLLLLNSGSSIKSCSWSLIRSAPSKETIENWMLNGIQWEGCIKLVDCTWLLLAGKWLYLCRCYCNLIHFLIQWWCLFPFINNS